MDAPVVCPMCHDEVPPGSTRCPRDGVLLADASAMEKTIEREVPTFASTHTAGMDELDDAGIEPTQKRDPLVGMKLGEYRIEERIGMGGMGIVYRGVQPMIGKPVAIKILRQEVSSDPYHVKRLLAEARAVNAIRHRGIIDIFGFGKLPDGRQYIVMEYLDGVALDTYIGRADGLSIQEAIELLDQMAGALAAAHDAGIVHRDLKPSNIYVLQEKGGSRYVKVLDFGLAMLGADPRGVTPQTRTSVVVGTPEYIAPEQARGKPIGPRTDLYALGVVAFQMVTGRLPFEAESPLEHVARHLDTPPPDPGSLRPDLSPELGKLILALLAKSPEDRPPSAQVVRDELKRISRELVARPKPAPAPAPTAAAPAPLAPSTFRIHAAGRFSLRSPWLLVGAGAVSFVAAVAFLISSVSSSEPKQANPPARVAVRLAQASPRAPTPAVAPALPTAPVSSPAVVPASKNPAVAEAAHETEKPLHANPVRPAAPLTRAALLQRLSRLDAALRKAAGSDEPDPIALAHLDSLRRQVEALGSSEASAELVQKVQFWEGKYLKH